jgi:hypothetical protein
MMTSVPIINGDATENQIVKKWEQNVLENLSPEEREQNVLENLSPEDRLLQEEKRNVAYIQEDLTNLILQEYNWKQPVINLNNVQQLLNALEIETSKILNSKDNEAIKKNTKELQNRIGVSWNEVVFDFS